MTFSIEKEFNELARNIENEYMDEYGTIEETIPEYSSNNPQVVVPTVPKSPSKGGAPHRGTSLTRIKSLDGCQPVGRPMMGTSTPQWGRSKPVQTIVRSPKASTNDAYFDWKSLTKHDTKETSKGVKDISHTMPNRTLPNGGTRPIRIGGGNR